ncbi:MAG: hypothetical protein UT84_C0001G0040 [Candidatus Curtissbacteria bacterium GW2011_GWA1_40_16]|uniref:Uncharacterized protein n=1 Tax=Candidatus Curtissbacteria bacterium GW2011_GWA1_40_16 TaxID=1618405 RepID=A0A0G0TW85_9BACT|nr:MAG: hypothetical protein UT84_C0001G0040 [Candidatus Curtissbacteria bacterium GW2011_GWA1_40_16]
MKLSSLSVVLIVIIAVSAYALSNWQKYGSFFGRHGYKNVKLVDLVGFANLYNGKDVCTNGYIIEGNNTLFIKDSVLGSKFEGSAWVVNNTGSGFLFNTSNTVTKATMARACGHFVSKGESEFGNPPFWKHQLTINEFSALEESFAVDY